MAQSQGDEEHSRAPARGRPRDPKPEGPLTARDRDDCVHISRGGHFVLARQGRRCARPVWSTLVRPIRTNIVAVAFACRMPTSCRQAASSRPTTA